MATTAIPAQGSRVRVVLAARAEHAHRAARRRRRPAHRAARPRLHLHLPRQRGDCSAGSTGPASTQSANYFANTAHLHPGKLFAVLGGTIEFAGGIALALGFFSRLAGLAIFGDMMMAIITVTQADGFNSTAGAGCELNLALGVLALVPAFFGSGRFSVDAVLERRLLRAGTGAAAPIAARRAAHSDLRVVAEPHASAARSETREPRCVVGRAPSRRRSRR